MSTDIDQHGWQRWVLESNASVRVGQSVAVGAGVGLLVCASIVLMTLATQRPIAVAAAPLLLIPGIPLIAVGQLWGITVLKARGPQPSGWLQMQYGSRRLTRRESSKLFFGGLPKHGRIAVTMLWLSAWACAMFLSVPFLVGGSAGTAHPGFACPWPLHNHGDTTCVTHSAYERAGAAGQRFPASILMGFFVMHIGITTSELMRRSKSKSSDALGADDLRHENGIDSDQLRPDEL